MWIKDNDMILERILEGPFPTNADLDVYKNVYNVDENGFPNGSVILIKDSVTVTWEVNDIKWFAQNHIEASYPQWKQSNIIQAGGAELTKMTTFINAVRTWSNQDPLPNPWDGTLEAITP
tara:strand:- start:116 stop:475 length:360 start_codon:yes stop_codon:yes gene_type:complete